jgi:hypothetical protein
MAKPTPIIATVIRVPKDAEPTFRYKPWAEALALAERTDGVSVHPGVDVRSVHPANCPDDHCVLREIDNGMTGVLFQNW